MAEHGLDGPVIGLSLDGTGYGTDGRIWGGEVLVCRLDGFERFAHLEYVPMPGGDAAVREPWRMALGHLHAAGFDVTSGPMLSLLGASAQDARLLTQMIARKLNTPLTSSLGRLFDAAAAIILGRRKVDYEAQAAIELEGMAVDEPDREDAYPMQLSGGDWPAHTGATGSGIALAADDGRCGEQSSEDTNCRTLPCGRGAWFRAGRRGGTRGYSDRNQLCSVVA